MLVDCSELFQCRIFGGMEDIWSISPAKYRAHSFIFEAHVDNAGRRLAAIQDL